MKKKKNYGIGIKLYRAERFFYRHHMKLISKLIYNYIYTHLSCSIPATCTIEDGVEFAHSLGIVIHPFSSIKKGTIVYQNVTIGNGKKGPQIGENCIIGSGAVILGDIVIGDNCKIGANAVVLNDIPSGCTVVGVPGRIVKQTKSEVKND